jgi:LDH2 family malate/lactate/ureidoglycolate dehydrogenase
MGDDGQAVPRYSAADLVTFATQLLERAGLDYAAVVAEVLVEADLMGHSTHGLNLLAPYLRDLEADAMTKRGEPITVSDTGAAVTWDGGYLPGPWLVTKAIDLALERLKAHPVVSVAIRRSHHIACLAAYLKRVTDQGYMILLASSDPHEQGVAPYGGIKGLYTPNPIAAGIPTQGDPILIDISMSTTALGMVNRHHQKGERLPHAWLLDGEGNATDDPAVMFTEPRGSVLPLGGTDLGYKGFALGLLVEALTSALAGGGRSTEPKEWGASVFLQLLNPEAFGGLDSFVRETEWFAEASRNNPTKPGNPPVRLPGSRALQLRAEQLEQGVALYPAIMQNLQVWAEKLGVALPEARRV